MRWILAAAFVTLQLGAPAAAECFDADSFFGIGTVSTKGGGTYIFGMTVGGESVTRGELQGRGNGLPDRSFDLYTPCHIDIADAGLARAIAPDIAGTVPDSIALAVTFRSARGLPDATPGTHWNGKFVATILVDWNNVGEVPLDGRYTFLDEISADFEGCTYRIFPVELVLTLKGAVVLKRRVLYFPDLGVSVITRWGPDADGPERKFGVTGFGYGG